MAQNRKTRPHGLDAEAARLWAQVTATVTPLAGRNHGSPPIKPRRPTTTITPPPAPIASAAVRPPTETLDGSWDRRIGSGRIRPDLVIDLHGHTRERARQLLHGRIASARRHGLRVILVITGKGTLPGPAAIDLMQERPVRGAIRMALPRWLAEPAMACHVAAVRRAHPRHGGSGAVYLILKRQRG